MVTLDLAFRSSNDRRPDDRTRLTACQQAESDEKRDEVGTGEHERIDDEEKEESMKKERTRSPSSSSFISTFGCSSASRGDFPFPLVSYERRDRGEGEFGRTKGTFKMSHASIRCTKLDEGASVRIRVPNSTFVKLNLVGVESPKLEEFVISKAICRALPLFLCSVLPRI